MKVWLEQQEITGLCVQVLLEKDADAAGMEARVQVMCAPEEEQLPRLNPSCGETLSVWEEEALLFTGQVETIRYDAAALTLTLQCFDPAARLARCQCYGPLKGKPGEIAAALCRECGLEPGYMAPGDGKQTRLGALCGRSAFRAIRQIYGSGYVVECRDGRVCVAAVGESRAVLETGKLLALTARSSAEEAINRVCICGRGELLEEAVDGESLKQQGLRQKTETAQPGYETLREQAEAGLKGLSREAQVTLEGLYPVRCGQRVTLEKPLAGAWGDYTVSSVRLCCRGGRKTTELGLTGI